MHNLRPVLSACRSRESELLQHPKTEVFRKQRQAGRTYLLIEALCNTLTHNCQRNLQNLKVILRAR